MCCGAGGLIIAALFPDLVTLSVNSLFLLLVLVPSIIGGFFWRQGTSQAAVSSIFAGMIVTGVFLALDPTTAFVPGFVSSAVTYVIVSLMTRHGTEENLAVVGGWNQSARSRKEE